MRSYIYQYIDGKWVDSHGGRRHEVISPATERPCAEITLGSRDDVDRAVVAARAAFQGWSQSSIEIRKQLLARIIEAYQVRFPDLARAVAEEMGAPLSFCMAAQVPSGLGHFISTLEALDHFAFEESVGGAKVIHEPIGVVAMITPWNWPLNQICAKIAPALAAGNSMILKPSEEAPGCAMILAEVLEAAGVPKGVFNLINGDGLEVGMALCEHEGVDMVSFTGSTRAGIAVAQAAAPTVKRVHQELGGKAPNLILEGADLPTTLGVSLMGVLLNSGQSCVAPTRLLVHESQKNDAIHFIKAVMEQTTVGDPLQEGNHIGPVVNKSQYEKILGLIASAIDEGATVVTGGLERPDGNKLGYFMRPTLLADVTPDMRIAREEIFGPVATLTTYRSLDEAVELANATPYGLSAAISGDPGQAARVAPMLRAGLVTINGWTPNNAAPFGGYKRSGNGREYGRYGLAEFMEVKTITGAP